MIQHIADVLLGNKPTDRAYVAIHLCGHLPGHGNGFLLFNDRAISTTVQRIHLADPNGDLFAHLKVWTMLTLRHFKIVWMLNGEFKPGVVIGAPFNWDVS